MGLCSSEEEKTVKVQMESAEKKKKPVHALKPAASAAAENPAAKKSESNTVIPNPKSNHLDAKAEMQDDDSKDAIDILMNANNKREIDENHYYLEAPSNPGSSLSPTGDTHARFLASIREKRAGEDLGILCAACIKARRKMKFHFGSSCAMSKTVDYSQALRLYTQLGWLEGMTDTKQSVEGKKQFREEWEQIVARLIFNCGITLCCQRRRESITTLEFGQEAAKRFLFPSDLFKDVARALDVAMDLTFAQLSGLRTLILDGNVQFCSLPSSIWRLSSLQTLHACGCRLRSIPPSIRHLCSLQRLMLNDNRLETLPEELKHCVNLCSLELRNNKIRALPKSVFQLRKLRSIDLRDNLIDALPLEEGQQWASLRNLFMAGNPPIKRVPYGLSKLPLETVDLHLCSWGKPSIRAVAAQDGDQGMDTLRWLRRVHAGRRAWLRDVASVENLNASLWDVILQML